MYLRKKPNAIGVTSMDTSRNSVDSIQNGGIQGRETETETDSNIEDSSSITDCSSNVPFDRKYHYVSHKCLQCKE